VPDGEGPGVHCPLEIGAVGKRISGFVDTGCHNNSVLIRGKEHGIPRVLFHEIGKIYRKILIILVLHGPGLGNGKQHFFRVPGYMPLFVYIPAAYRVYLGFIPGQIEVLE
jgi:hypothetical protein